MAFSIGGMKIWAPSMMTALMFSQPSSTAFFTAPTAYIGWLPMLNEYGLVSSDGVIGQHAPNHVMLGLGDHRHDRLGEERERADDRHHALFDRLPGTRRRHGRVELLVADGDLERPAGDPAASVDVVGVRVGGVGDVLVGRPGGVERGHGHDLDRITARCVAAVRGGGVRRRRRHATGAPSRRRRTAPACVAMNADVGSNAGHPSWTSCSPSCRYRGRRMRTDHRLSHNTRCRPRTSGCVASPERRGSRRRGQRDGRGTIRTRRPL